MPKISALSIIPMLPDGQLSCYIGVLSYYLKVSNLDILYIGSGSRV